MSSDFAGSTAEHYRRFRRDVPGVVLDELVNRLGLGLDSLAVDLGAGTGQVAVPLAARVGTVVAIDPEPAMVGWLRERTVEEQVENVLCVLGSDRDLGVVAAVVGGNACGLVAIANALHWMHRYQAAVDLGYIIGHVYSAMPESMVPASRRP